MKNIFTYKVRKWVAAVLIGSAAFSIFVITLVVVRSPKATRPSNSQAAGGICTDSFSVASSKCNEGCFIDQDCETGLKCIGAAGTTTAGSCHDPLNPTSTTCPASNAKGDFGVLAFSGNTSATFNFTATWPSGAWVMAEPSPNISITTRLRGTVLDGGAYAGRSKYGWIKGGSLITVASLQPPTGWCLVDTGTISLKTGNYFDSVWTGKACRNTTTTIQNHMGRNMQYKFAKCSVSNWDSTNCTTDLTLGEAENLNVLNLTFRNSGLINTTFSTNANMEGSLIGDNSDGPRVAGAASVLLQDINGKSQFTLKPGETATYEFNVYASKVSSVTTNVASGKLDMLSAQMYEVSEDKTLEGGSDLTVSVNQPDGISTAVIPVADARVEKNYPSKNYGSTSTLVIDGDPVELTYMKFDLRAYAGKQITSAKLNLRIVDSSGSTQTFKVVDDNNWTESGITYDNRPAAGSTITTINGGKSGGFVAVDVTSAVVSKLSSGTISIMGDYNGTDGLDFYSKEGSIKPTLVVTYK